MNKAITIQETAPDVLEVVKPKRRPISIGDLVKQFPKMREPVVDGLLREGEIMNVIASPKVRKSWLALQLAFAVSTGSKWLGHVCTPGRVLIIDNELHKQTVSARVRSVADALEETPGDRVEVEPVRGEGWDIVSVLEYAEDIEPGEYSLLILDALYRFLPEGTSENDNAQMMKVYNTLDAIAKRTGAAIVVVHHSSKGDQTGKAQTDVGAGAGSIARAADCHLSIRPHAEADNFVLEASCRSFPPPDPKSIYFKMPLWYESALEPELRQAGKPRVQETRDEETTATILELLGKAGGKALTHHKIRDLTGYGFQRIQRGAMLLEKQERVKRVRIKSKKTKKPTDAIKATTPPQETGGGNLEEFGLV